MTANEERKYWFPAKRYGWGWGAPRVWQGWAVLIGYFALVLGGIPLIQARIGDLPYAEFLLAISAVFVTICWLTGEPPRWRWGQRDN